ncbi:hypothetical protein BH18ACT13_BH18ACT13_20960 [soil metagenome]
MIRRLSGAPRDDAWIIRIAVAVGIAYATLRLLEELVAVLLAIFDGLPALGNRDGDTFYPYATVINGHFILLEPLLRAFALFVVVAPFSWFPLRATRATDPDPGAADAPTPDAAA